MKIQYLHPELGKEVIAPAGYYLPSEENILLYKGKKVLYVVGTVYIDSACCSGGTNKGWNYIQVPGYINKERVLSEKTDFRTSEIETIEDEDDRANITKRLLEKYPYARIEI